MSGQQLGLYAAGDRVAIVGGRGEGEVLAWQPGEMPCTCCAVVLWDGEARPVIARTQNLVLVRAAR